MDRYAVINEEEIKDKIKVSLNCMEIEKFLDEKDMQGLIDDLYRIVNDACFASEEEVHDSYF